MEPDNFAACFEKYATPFLKRQEAHHPGTSEQLLTDYLCLIAKDDLRPCLYIFKTAHTKVIRCLINSTPTSFCNVTIGSVLMIRTENCPDIHFLSQTPYNFH